MAQKNPGKTYPSRHAAYRGAKRDAGIPMDHPVFVKHPDNKAGRPGINYEDPDPRRVKPGQDPTFGREEYNVGTRNSPRYVAIDDHHAGHANPRFKEERPHIHARPGTGPDGRDYRHGTAGEIDHHYYEERKKEGSGSNPSGSNRGGGSKPSSS